jgi:hypothetical protein
MRELLLALRVLRYINIESALSLGGSNTVSLSAGNYYFTSIQSLLPFNFGNTLNLDLSGGPINIFVSGDVNLGLGTGGGVLVNGQSVADFSGNPNKTVEPLASEVFLESLGNVTVSGQFFGTIFTPEGNIDPNGVTVIGSLIAGKTASDPSNVNTVNVYSVPAHRFQELAAVPEPASFTLLDLGALGLLGYGWRRRKQIV